MTDAPAQEAAEYFRKADIVERRSDSASGYGNFHYVHSATISRALRLLAAVESGEWKVVPREPTVNMVDEGNPWVEGDSAPIYCDNTKLVYTAMLQAAPDFFAGEKEG